MMFSVLCRTQPSRRDKSLFHRDMQTLSVEMQIRLKKVQRRRPQPSRTYPALCNRDQMLKFPDIRGKAKPTADHMSRTSMMSHKKRGISAPRTFYGVTIITPSSPSLVENKHTQESRDRERSQDFCSNHYDGNPTASGLTVDTFVRPVHRESEAAHVTLAKTHKLRRRKPKHSHSAEA